MIGISVVITNALIKEDSVTQLCEASASLLQLETLRLQGQREKCEKERREGRAQEQGSLLDSPQLPSSTIPQDVCLGAGMKETHLGWNQLCHLLFSLSWGKQVVSWSVPSHYCRV